MYGCKYQSEHRRLSKQFCWKEFYSMSSNDRCEYSTRRLLHSEKLLGHLGDRDRGCAAVSTALQNLVTYVEKCITGKIV